MPVAGSIVLTGGMTEAIPSGTIEVFHNWKSLDHSRKVNPMRKSLLATLLFVAAVGIAGCSDTSDETTSSTTSDPNPRVEPDARPETGTGGDQQPAAPAGPRHDQSTGQ